MLETLKELLNITDNSKDTILNFYITKAQNAIKHYCNNTDLTGLDSQVTELAMFYYNNKSNLGKRQSIQGSRSETLIDGIPQSIKDTLPYPLIKVY